MPPITSFFHPPSWSQAYKGQAPERKPARETRKAPEAISSPLSDPPPSTFIDPTSEPEAEDDPDPGAQLDEDLSQSVVEDTITSSAPTPAPKSSPEPSPVPKNEPERELAPAPAPEHSFQNIAPPISSFESTTASQRIVKDGMEVVISSDGEDTDSPASLEDPDVLFVSKHKKAENDMPTNPKEPIGKALLAQLSKPKKYQNSIDSLVNDVVNHNKIEESVAKVKATFAQTQPNEQFAPGQDETQKKALHEGMLTSALGNHEDDGGAGFRRLLDAVRRTEALEQDRTWHFLDRTQMTSGTPDFPTDLFAPGSNLAMLREPDSRIRAFQSGVLEFAAASQRLPDIFIHWLFHSVALEPREELRKAYCRVFTQPPPRHEPHQAQHRIQSIIRPNDIDILFQYLGAKRQALDLSEVIDADPPEHSSQGPRLKDRAILISVFDLLRDSADLLLDDTRERAIHLLLRITIDASLTADFLVRSELQSTLSSLLEAVPEASTEDMDHRICTVVFETVKHIQFQSRMLQLILPTSPWISLLRYRLAVAFLLQIPEPLTEPPVKVLDLKRLTVFLARDERFNLKHQKSKGDYDYGDLSATCMLLDIVVNTSLYDIQYKQAETAREFDAAVDKLAAQIKNIFSSIEDTGASHLKRMLAKEALEALHYRVIYSVRSQPPPKKTLFKTYAREYSDIRDFAKKFAIDTNRKGTPESVDESGSTAMPIRGGH